MKRLKYFAESLEKNGLLERIAEPVSTDYECARILKQYDGKKAVFFEKPLGYRIPIIGNVVTNRNVLYSALGVRNDEEAFSKLLDAMSNPQRLKVEGLPSTFRRFESIETLPVLRSFEGTRR